MGAYTQYTRVRTCIYMILYIYDTAFAHINVPYVTYHLHKHIVLINNSPITYLLQIGVPTDNV